MPLTMADAGAVQTIKTVRGKDQTRRFLAGLGFVEGADVTIVSAAGGNLIVNIKDSRVAISQSMAARIMV